MAKAMTKDSAQRSLRVWPGVIIVLLMWLARYVVPAFVPEALFFGLMGGVFGGGAAIVLWWLFFSRAPWLERLGVLALIIIALVATSQIIDKSIATAGQGMFFTIYTIPVMSLALVVWAVASQRLSDGSRRAVLVATILLVCGGWAVLRIDGITGDFGADFAWRWAETVEERLLARAGDTPDASGVLPASAVAEKESDWPGFRGPNRDGIIHDVRIETDWSASPPVELWRRPIGPAISSFAVRGNFFYTQEQRGEDEVVACYNLTTGEPVWQHSDATRFWDSHAGAGPRGTPTLDPAGRGVYTFGATGIVNALDARDGTVVWSRNAASDAKVKIPQAWWGFSSSPLLVDDLVMVAARGKLVAYDIVTGNPRWFGPDSGGSGYSSPHFVTLDSVAQILLHTGLGVVSVAPADGTLLWKHALPLGARIVQPALIPKHRDDVLLTVGEYGDGNSIRRITVTHNPAGWTSQERWTSTGLKPNFSDFVVHDGYAFGFDGSILACIDLENGKRKWKGGRYGHGQLVLLADQGLLLVVSEQGELALVKATPDKFTGLARFPALDGKTWNHPAMAGDVLLVRNTEEMAAFRLPARVSNTSSAQSSTR